MRFFTRAVELYDQGLRTFPMSLDLAYNKFVVRPVLRSVLLAAIHEGLT